MSYRTKRKYFELVIALCIATPFAHAAEQKFLQITVLEGEGSFNDIKRGIGRPLRVEVRDENRNVIEGAKVVFLLPESSASGTFPDGGRTFISTTDKEGRAGSPAVKPNRIEGRFAILVNASSPGRVGKAEIMETNTLAGGDQSMRSGHGKLKFILAIAASAATGGIIAATRGGSSAPAATTQSPTTLSTGTVTIGGPR